MPVKYINAFFSGIKLEEIAVSLFVIALLAGLHFSRAVVSVASVGIWCAAAYQLIRLRNFKLSVLSFLLLILALLWLLDGPRAVEVHDWSDNFKIKSGFVLTALSFLGFRRMHTNTKLLISYGLVLSFLLTSTVSVIHYFQSAQEINTLLLQSKHVPLFSNMHHIHFGLFLAVAIFTATYLTASTGTSTVHRWLFGGIGLVLLFNLHVLSSRTGLTGFYAAGFAVVVMVMIISRDLRLKLALIVGFVLLPAIFVGSLPSLRSKVLNTTEDLEATVEGGGDINHKSFGMRLEAWKSTALVISQHWMVGVGIGNQDLYMARAYEERQTPLSVDNRKSTHNQLLETFMTNGLPGVISLGLILLICGIMAFRSRSWLYMALLIICVWGLQFESLLERQHGAFFVAFVLFFYWPEDNI